MSRFRPRDLTSLPPPDDPRPASENDDGGPAVASQASGPRVVSHSHSQEHEMHPDGTALPAEAEEPTSHLSAAAWLSLAACQLRSEGQEGAASVLDRLVEDRLRTSPERRRGEYLRWEAQVLRRGLDSALGGGRSPNTNALLDRASDLTRAELRIAGLYGSASERLLKAA